MTIRTFTNRRAVCAAVAGALTLLLTACEQKPSSTATSPADRAQVQGGDVKGQASAPPSGQASAQEPVRREPPDPATLVAQARSEPAAPGAPASQPADKAEERVLFPQGAPAAGKPSASRPVSDAELAARVKSAVLAEPLSALLFNVNVSNGVVTLSGTADSAATRDKAARAASGVEGVKSVNNRITVASGS